jgi:uncharacterized phage protein gp47/JayE
MPFFSRSKQDIVIDGLQKLRQNTGITQMSPGGKARFFIDTVAEEHSSMNEVFDANLLQAFLSSSEGKFLDFFGDMLQVPRLEPVNARSVADNFMFYVDTGSFGDINNGTDFSVPAGTRVMVPPYDGTIITPGLTSSEDVLYRLKESVICKAEESFVYGKIEATVEGRFGNVPSGVLKLHNFTGYANAASGLLKCNNRYSIDSGDERETDGAYRFRLMQAFRSKERATRTAIRLAALSVPGVSDIQMVAREQGPGTFSVYIKGLTPTPSPQLIESVTFAINSVGGEGEKAFILPPSIIGVEFIVHVNWRPNTSDLEKNSQYNTIRENIESFLNGMNIGGFLTLDSVVSVILSSAPNATSIGFDNANKLEEVYIYRGGGNYSLPVRSKFLSDTIYTMYNERIVLETSTSYRGIKFI